MINQCLRERICTGGEKIVVTYFLQGRRKDGGLSCRSRSGRKFQPRRTGQILWQRHRQTAVGGSSVNYHSDFSYFLIFLNFEIDPSVEFKLKTPLSFSNAQLYSKYIGTVTCPFKSRTMYKEGKNCGKWAHLLLRFGLGWLSMLVFGPSWPSLTFKTL